jgi:hypothetical protein
MQSKRQCWAGAQKQRLCLYKAQIPITSVTTPGPAGLKFGGGIQRYSVSSNAHLSPPKTWSCSSNKWPFTACEVGRSYVRRIPH